MSFVQSISAIVGGGAALFGVAYTSYEFGNGQLDKATASAFEKGVKSGTDAANVSLQKAKVRNEGLSEKIAGLNAEIAKLRADSSQDEAKIRASKLQADLTQLQSQLDRTLASNSKLRLELDAQKRSSEAKMARLAGLNDAQKLQLEDARRSIEVQRVRISSLEAASKVGDAPSGRTLGSCLPNNVVTPKIDLNWDATTCVGAHVVTLTHLESTGDRRLGVSLDGSAIRLRQGEPHRFENGCSVLAVIVEKRGAYAKIRVSC